MGNPLFRVRRLDGQTDRHSKIIRSISMICQPLLKIIYIQNYVKAFNFILLKKLNFTLLILAQLANNFILVPSNKTD